MSDYELLVIGGGPAGQRAAVQAAKLRKRVAMVDRREFVGGVCVNSGTIPSKSFKEAVVFLSGYRQRGMYGSAYRVKTNIEMADLTYRCNRIMQVEIDVIRNQLMRNRVEVITGVASFIDPNTLAITERDGTVVEKRADKILIAVGAEPLRPAGIAFDNQKIFDSDSILDLEELPREMTVVGGGVIGSEYCSMFAALGVQVTLIDARKRLLSFVDEEIIECLKYHFRSMGVTLRLGEEVLTCQKQNDGQVVTELRSGKLIISDCVLFSAGRQSATALLGLDKVGIETDDRGRISVNSSYQTNVDHIYAAGDVIGFPALASTSGMQGRLAASHAFGLEAEASKGPLPFGIYSIPEISYVGQSEDELTEAGVPYETGVARYREIARGLILGDDDGMLKLIFHRESLKVLGVHVIGENATELVHIGQAVMSLGGDLRYFRDSVFNYPTLAECYKVAALDGFNKLR